MTEPKPTETEIYAKSALKQGYIRRLLVGADKMINLIFLGPPDDTISARLLRWKLGVVPKNTKWKRDFGWFGCGALGLIQKWHDLKANAGDYGRARAEMERTRKTIEAAGAKPPEGPGE